MINSKFYTTYAALYILEKVIRVLHFSTGAYTVTLLNRPLYGPQPVMKYLQRQKHRAANLPAAPEKPGHFAVMFCTFGGGHTGFGETIPLLKYMGQAFEHEGIRIVEEWPVVGDFPEIKDPFYNTAGRLGDVTGRPNDYDLRIVAGQTSGLLRRLKLKLGIEELIK